MTSVKNNRLTRIFVGIIAFIITINAPVSVLALNPADYSRQQIDFYHRDAGAYACGPDSAGGEALVGNDSATKIWNFLRGLDGNLPAGRALSKEQAAGLMGNIRQEAGKDFDPAATESGGGGYGIVQWTGSRRTNLENAAKKKGVAVSDLAFQLSYLYQESNSRKVSGKVADQGFGTKGANEWTTMMQQVAKRIGGKDRTAIENATVYWHNNFEVSADTADFVLGQRGEYSREVFTRFTGEEAPDASADQAGSSGSCDEALGSGDLSAKTLAYAWPEYHPAPYTTKKPEYATAVKKAQSEGRYVGGLAYPGVDCGGFVTTLLVDSGFEPEYNHGGKFSKGAGNTVTQKAWAASNWKTLGNGSSINVADLQPGDVAFSPGHTFVYVGTIPGFESKIASASVSFSGNGWRSPMAGKESPTSGDVTWYRKGA